MELKISNSAILLAFGIVATGHAGAQETLILPPTPLQLLVDKNASTKTSLKREDLANLLRNHKADLFSEEPDIKKFLLLQELCENLKNISEGKELQPMLLKEISAQKAIDRPPVGWDEIMMSGHGGGIGLLMDCVMQISGEAGFNEIFDSVVTAGDPVKMKILLAQIAIRNERKKYDPILDVKLKTLQSPRLKEVVEAHLKAVPAEK